MMTENSTVFETIYADYEGKIIAELEKLKSDDEIDEMLDLGIIHDAILKILAKALSVAVYRNGKIEDIHAGECDGDGSFKGIPDACMKEINIDVCNKMYTMLKLLLSEDDDSLKMAKADIAFGAACASEWYDPIIDESLCSSKLLKLLD